MPRLGLVVAVGLIACSKRVDHKKARHLFTEVVVDTKPGLSGLAADDTGGIWAIAERGGKADLAGRLAQADESEAYRITLDANLVPTIERFPVRGIPAGTDLEAIEWLGPQRFAFGTEGETEGIATVLTAIMVDHEIDITGAIVLDGETLGMTVKANQGAEGVCGAGDTIVAAIEGATEHEGKRWAPVVRIEHGKVVRTHRLRLLTTTGKISSLDCVVEPDGTIEGWAIERHFQVTLIVRFTLPPVGQGSDTIHPVEMLDLGPVLNSRLNLEGIAQTPDGHVVAAVDNQYSTITGPSELLVFKPGVLTPIP